MFWKYSGFIKPGQAATEYWGWNEIPVDRLAIGNPQNWDAVMIHVPAEICGGGTGGSDDAIACLSIDNQWRLEANLNKWVEAGYLIPGKDNIGSRPGSYVVFSREFYLDEKWLRVFFCDGWTSPSGKYQIMSYAQGNDDDGACYIDWGTTSAAMASPMV